MIDGAVLGLIGIALVGWAAQVLVAWLGTMRPLPAPGPATLDPGPEAPAVASLLLLGRRFGPAARAATLLDLAARESLDLEWRPGTLPVCTAVRAPWTRPPPPFEQHVLGRVRARWRRPGTPVAALLPDARDSDRRRWYAEFDRLVVEEAERAGLVMPRLHQVARALLMIAAGVPAAMLVSFLWGWGAGATWPAVLLGFAVWAGLAACVPRGHRRTEAGRDAARRWLGVRAAVRDRGLPALDGDGWTPLRDPLPARAVATGAGPALVATLTT